MSTFEFIKQHELKHAAKFRKILTDWANENLPMWERVKYDAEASCSHILEQLNKELQDLLTKDYNTSGGQYSLNMETKIWEHPAGWDSAGILPEGAYSMDQSLKTK